MAASNDTDADILRDAGSTVVEIDVQYRVADVNEQRKLRPRRDKAYSEYSRVRLALMRSGTITTDQDVLEMRQIRAEVEAAANTQAIVTAILRFVAFLARL